MFHLSRWLRLSEAFTRLNRPVVVIDLESTGGNLYQDRVTEIAFLRFENGRVEHYEQLINPGKPIPEFVVQLTGITNEMVAEAPAFDQIASNILPLLRGALIVAHNSRFDYTFLRHEFCRAGIDFAAPALCTVQLSRRLYPQFYKHNLDSIISRIGIQTDERHRALADVLALADYLEHSLKEKTSEEWDNHCRSLMNPKMLPTQLSDSLAAKLYSLPDTVGVLVWFDHSGKVQSVEAYEKTYSEIAALLHSKEGLPYIQNAADVKFIPAVGSLHALWLKAQVMQEYQGELSAPFPLKQLNPKTFMTVKFVPDEHGVLKARIVPLDNGSSNVRPYGLFIHKKAAKRALSIWAQEHNFCPDALNILPVSHAKGALCPVQAVGKCNGTCHKDNEITEQNIRIHAMASKLPVADWGKVHEVEITEADELSGRSVIMRCAGGALELPNGHWYFDNLLPSILKIKFKRDRQNIRVIA